MKKVLFALVGILFMFNVQAQDRPTGDEGQEILPEAGEIGLGVNMIPFFNWFGNTFNNNSNNTYASADKFFNVLGNSVVMGKYMLDEKSAVRVHFGFNSTFDTDREYVFDDASNDPMMRVMDTRRRDNGHYTLALGYEMRRGKGRLQGYFGGDLVLRLRHSGVAEYTYGNGFSAANVVPTSYNFGGNIQGNRRVLSDGGSTTFGTGVRGFVGVEYFVAPKLSIGAEFGWGVMIDAGFESTTTSEWYEATTGEVMIENETNAASTDVSFGLDNINGAVFMFFYF